ncbi:hypothetical protein GCM10025871_21940 [Deinococcus metallilatus]|nr:hypothetical protein GCM10025871_21940 [Deinococcus metallilatus]
MRHQGQRVEPRQRPRPDGGAQRATAKPEHPRPSFTADSYRHVYKDEHEEWALDLSDPIEGRRKA